MRLKLLLALIISGLIITGCVTKTEPPPLEEPTTYQLFKDQLKVTINESHAWLDLMPGDDVWRKHISIAVEIENNAGFDLNNLHIDKAEVIKNSEVVGDFKPKFQIREDCSGKFDNEKFVDEINLSKGCKLSFNIRAWRSPDNLSDFEGTIKSRFKFVSNDYSSNIYETNEMIITRVS